MAVSLGRLEVETPDHVVLRYDLAGGGNRGFAALVDALIVLVLVLVTNSAGTPLPVKLVVGFQNPYDGVIFLASVALAWTYYVLLEWLWNGQTLGKRLSGLRVITGDGSPAPFIACLIRNLVRIADWLPGFYGVGLLAILLSSKAQRLGDVAAGTYVVRAPRPRLDYFSLRTVTPLGEGPAGSVRGLSGEAQRLVREYVAREAGLVPAERVRVAALIAARLRPLVPEGAEEADDVEFLRSLARALRASGDAPGVH